MDIQKLMKGDKVVVKYAESSVNSGFVKIVRNKYHLTQSALANILGISDKTVSKWEQGISKVNGSSAILLSLIYEFPDILSKIRDMKVYMAK